MAFLTLLARYPGAHLVLNTSFPGVFRRRQASLQNTLPDKGGAASVMMKASSRCLALLGSALIASSAVASSSAYISEGESSGGCYPGIYTLLHMNMVGSGFAVNWAFGLRQILDL